MKMLKVGDIVWSKTLGYPFWPGQIESTSKIHDSVKKAGKAGQVLVKYINDKNVGWVYEHELLDFQKHYPSLSNQKVNKSLNPSFKKALRMALAYNLKGTQGHDIIDLDADVVTTEDSGIFSRAKRPRGPAQRPLSTSINGTSRAASSAPAITTRSAMFSKLSPAGIAKGGSQPSGRPIRSRVPRIRVKFDGSVPPRPRYPQTSPSESGSELEGGGKGRDRRNRPSSSKKRSLARLDDADDPYKKERVSYRRPRPPRTELASTAAPFPDKRSQPLEQNSSTASARSSSASLPALGTAISTRSSGPAEEPLRKDESDVDTYSAPKRRHNIQELWPYIISLADDLLDHQLINDAEATDIKLKAVHKDEQLRTIYLAATLSDGFGKLQRFSRSYRDVFARSMC